LVVTGKSTEACKRRKNKAFSDILREVLVFDRYSQQKGSRDRDRAKSRGEIAI